MNQLNSRYYVYATLLPDGHVKIGYTSKPDRPWGAQAFHVKPVEVLAVWAVGHHRDEYRAHQACADLWVTRELFRVPEPHWLDIGHPIVERISKVLGKPVTPLPWRRPPGGRRMSWQSKRS